MHFVFLGYLRGSIGFTTNSILSLMKLGLRRNLYLIIFNIIRHLDRTYCDVKDFPLVLFPNFWCWFQINPRGCLMEFSHLQGIILTWPSFNFIFATVSIRKFIGREVLYPSFHPARSWKLVTVLNSTDLSSMSVQHSN